MLVHNPSPNIGPPCQASSPQSLHKAKPPRALPLLRSRQCYPSESRAIRRIMGNRRHPRKALDQGYNITAQEVASGATSGRYSRINASAHCHSSTINHGKRRPRDMPAIQAPTNGASGTQQRRRSNQETPCYRIGSRGKNPSSARHEGKSCLQPGVVRARKHRRAQSCRSFALTRLAGLTFQKTTLDAAQTLTTLAALASPQRCESRSRSQSSGAQLCAKQTQAPHANRNNHSTARSR